MLPLLTLYVEPLSVVVPEMRYVSGEEHRDSDKDLDDTTIASFIQAKRRSFATPDPTPK